MNQENKKQRNEVTSGKGGGRGIYANQRQRSPENNVQTDGKKRSENKQTKKIERDERSFQETTQRRTTEPRTPNVHIPSRRSDSRPLHRRERFRSDCIAVRCGGLRETANLYERQSPNASDERTNGQTNRYAAKAELLTIPYQTQSRSSVRGAFQTKERRKTRN